MRILAGIILLCLAACDIPGPGFRDVPVTRVRVGPSIFDIRVAGLRAEAIRLTPEPAPRLASVAPRGVRAIEAVSGCRVRRLDGDAALMTAWLDCGGERAPLPREAALDCTIDVVYETFADMTCVEENR